AHEWRAWRYVFCRFTRTVDAVRSGALDVGAELAYVTGAGGGGGGGAASVYGFDAAVVRRALRSDAAATDDDRRYTVLLALLYRVHRGHALMRRFADRDTPFAWSEPRAGGASGGDDDDDEQGRRAVHFHAQLFVDTHLDLCAHMQRYRAYSDADVTQVDRNPDDLLRAAAQTCAPDDHRAPNCYALPDASACLPMGNVWFAVAPKTRVRTVASAMIHILGCKTQSHKCQVRNFMGILRAYFDSYPVMASLFRMMVEVSMLGNYPHACYRPSFETRVRVRDSFRSPAMTDERLLAWMECNGQLVFYATKEFHRFLVEQTCALDAVMEETTDWTRNKQAVARAMDIVRSALDNERGDADAALAGVQRDLRAVHQTLMLPCISKLQKGGFVPVIKAAMDRFFEKYVLDARSAVEQSSGLELRKRFAATAPAADPDASMARLVDAVRTVVAARFSER
ncbi:hypothetical protein LCGC14_2638520, partial [marine sediment metagenome]